MARSRRPTTSSISANGATADRSRSTNKRERKRPSKNINPSPSNRQGSYGLSLQARDYAREIGGLESFANLPGNIQHRGRIERKLSVACNERRCALFRYRGPVRFEYNPNLCFFCYRSVGRPVAKVSGG
jgi:hypothetical protein